MDRKEPRTQEDWNVWAYERGAQFLDWESNLVPTPYRHQAHRAWELARKAAERQENDSAV